MRTPFGRYPEYHTSADNLSFVRPQSLADSFVQCVSAIHVLENNRTFVNQNPECEPQLGKRGLYRSIGGAADGQAARMAILWVLNLSDGRHSLLDVAERSGMRFEDIHDAALTFKTTDCWPNGIRSPKRVAPLGPAKNRQTTSEEPNTMHV